MIYERELHFSEQQFENKKNFPDILIVRKRKDQDIRLNLNNWQGVMNMFKTQLKLQTENCIETINQKSKEQKQHFSNSIIHLENDITSITRGVERLFTEIKKMIPNSARRLRTEENSPSPMSRVENTQDMVTVNEEIENEEFDDDDIVESYNLESELSRNDADELSLAPFTPVRRISRRDVAIMTSPEEIPNLPMTDAFVTRSNNDQIENQLRQMMTTFA